jgi:Ferredoxin
MSKKIILDIVFNNAMSKINVNPEESILINLESNGYKIKNSCRRGLCGSCLIKIIDHTTGNFLLARACVTHQINDSMIEIIL